VEVKKAVPRSQQNQYLHEQNRGQNSYFRTNDNDMNFKFYFILMACLRVWGQLGGVVVDNSSLVSSGVLMDVTEMMSKMALKVVNMDY
ncbi:hypothetical protein Tco_1459848, partial [Tanacetum coccineum]